MPLHKIRDFNPDYQRHFDDRDLLKFDVYSGSEKVGSVDDLLVDDAGQFRYLVVNTGAWIVGKKVLVPIGIVRIDDGSHRIYVDGLTREQAKNLPEYKGDPVDYDYEERVRTVYRPVIAAHRTTPAATPYDRTSYRYDRDPDLYNLRHRDRESLRHSEARMMSGRPIAGKHRRAVGVFPNRPAAEQAMHELKDSGFPMGRVSIITRDADKHDNDIAGAEVRDRVGNKADEGATIGAVSGGVLGGLTGLLVGLGTLAIPGIGPIMLAGATATTLATTLAGGAIGAVSGGLLGALIGLGIPEEQARVYEERIARGGYLVIVDGTDEDIARAEAILHHRGIEDYGVYDAPSATSTPLVATVPATETVPVDHRTAPKTNITPVGRRSAVGFFSNLSDAEQAVTDLRSIGFPLSQITLVANNLQRRERFAGIDLRDRFDAVRWGIPAEQARLYNDRLARGENMVIVHGTEDDLNRAAPILNRRGIQDWRMYNLTDMSTAPQMETSTVPSIATPPRQVDQHAVGFFPRLQDADQAIADLRSAGFPLSQVSLVGSRFERREPFAGVNLLDRFDNTRFGFPEERYRAFHNRIDRGDYLLVIHGSREQLRQAEAILTRPRVHDFAIYDAPGVSPTASAQASVEHPIAADIPALRDRDPRIEQPHPNVTIVNHRDETRL